MREIKYFAFDNNGLAKKGSRWRNAPARDMRNAFFKMHQEGTKGFTGNLYYQTALSDEWSEKWISCHSGQTVYGKVKSNFVPCTEQEFNEYTKPGFDIAAKKQEEKKEKASSISYLNNKFIYNDHEKMTAPDKLDHYLRNNLIQHNSYNGLHVRSFIIEVVGETDTLYKTKFSYLPTHKDEWKTKDKNFSKRKLERAFGAGLIIETTDDVIAKYSLISTEIPKKKRKAAALKPGSEVYDSFNLKDKCITMNGKDFRVGTLLRVSDRIGDMGNHHTDYGIIMNITEKNVIIIEEGYNRDRSERRIMSHKDFAYLYGRGYDFVNIHQDLRRDEYFITDQLKNAKEDFENHFLLRNTVLRELYMKLNPNWQTDK